MKLEIKSGKGKGKMKLKMKSGKEKGETKLKMKSEKEKGKMKSEKDKRKGLAPVGACTSTRCDDQQELLPWEQSVPKAQGLGAICA